MRFKIDQFLTWLDVNTDYNDWDDSVRKEVTAKMVEIFDPPKQHSWEFYMNGTFCKVCGVQIGTNMPCR